MPEEMIKADGLVKIYKTKQTEVLALQGLDLTVEAGELTAIIGNSGSGKSTFLNMIGGLDRPSAGSLSVGGKNLFTMTEKELVLYKRETVGFVWQNNGRNLLPYLTVLENIMLPMSLSDTKKKREKALGLLETVGLSARLFGAEQERPDHPDCDPRCGPLQEGEACGGYPGRKDQQRAGAEGGLCRPDPGERHRLASGGDPG